MGANLSGQGRTSLFHGSGLEELPAEDGTQWFSRIVTSGQLHNIAVCGDHERFEQFMRQRFLTDDIQPDAHLDQSLPVLHRSQRR
jgi:polyketide synthase PksN